MGKADKYNSHPGGNRDSTAKGKTGGGKKMVPNSISSSLKGSSVPPSSPKTPKVGRQ